MKRIFLPITASALLLLTACGGGNETKKQESTDTEPICFYQFTKNSTVTVNWTAFKTTEKVGVGGTFNQVLVKGGDKSTKITDIINGINFTIMTESTFTKDEGRDKKIIESFFGSMAATDLIIGHGKSAKGNNESGTAIFYLTMNDIEKEVSLDYTLNDNIITLTGEIDVLDWSGGDAIAALNSVCEDLHKGADGESKLWSVVELNISATLDKNCH